MGEKSGHLFVRVKFIFKNDSRTDQIDPESEQSRLVGHVSKDSAKSDESFLSIHWTQDRLVSVVNFATLLLCRLVDGNASLVSLNRFPELSSSATKLVGIIWILKTTARYGKFGVTDSIISECFTL